MVARNNSLGLHTPEEQALALRLAHQHFEFARNAINLKDIVVASFSLGYLQAIYELAMVEGIEGLSRDVERLIDHLEKLTKNGMI